jgi:ATP-dependent Clp protease ATP-binding subunit ClpA
MFESFTAGAERALKRADQLARRRGAIGVEPLDLLAALAAESESRATELLAECGVPRDRLWAKLEPDVLGFLTEFEGVEHEAGDLLGVAASQLLPPSPGLRLV